MRHDVQPVEESVGPDRTSAKRNSDGGVVDKELIIHHLELGVAADPEERSPNTDHGSIRDVGEPFDDQPVTGHLGKPVIVGTLGPVLGVVLPGDGENGHLVTEPVVILNHGVIGVLVADEERTAHGASIGVEQVIGEDLLIDWQVVNVHGSVEGDCDHLGNLSDLNFSWDLGAIG